MKRLLLTYLFLLFSSVIYSQVGINTNSPDPSSALDIQSTNGGILIPRLTQDQRDAIAYPATGLLIFQTNESAGFYFYNGEQWTRIEGAGFEQSSEAAAEGITEVIAGYGLSGGGNTGQVTLDIDFTTFSTVMPGLTDYVVGFDQTGESLIRISDILALAPEGNPGPVGPQGEQGEQGVRGDDGIDGAQGPDGPTGPQGPQGVAGTDGANGIDGAQGPQGEQGSAGPAGPTGPQGPQGVAGTEGTDGTNGLSAYEIWLNLGNSGTEQDFIDSLTGPQGETESALNSLILTTNIEAGNECQNGGVKIEIGLDSNQNGLLDEEEVESDQTKFICNGNDGVNSSTNTGASGSFVSDNINMNGTFWAAKSLDVVTFSDGTPIPQIQDLNEWTSQQGQANYAAWRWNDRGVTGFDGLAVIRSNRLYNIWAILGIYDEASRLNPSLRKTLSPEGYRIASYNDALELFENIMGVSYPLSSDEQKTNFSKSMRDTSFGAQTNDLIGVNDYGFSFSANYFDNTTAFWGLIDGHAQLSGVAIIGPNESETDHQLCFEVKLIKDDSGSNNQSNSNEESGVAQGSGTSPATYYETVNINDVYWSSKNLESSAYSDGTPIPQIQDEDTFRNYDYGAWRWAYHDGQFRHKLYNYNAIKGIYNEASIQDPALRKSLAPDGFRLPTSDDAKELYLHLTGVEYNINNDNTIDKLASVALLNNFYFFGNESYSMPNFGITGLSFTPGSTSSNEIKIATADGYFEVGDDAYIVSILNDPALEEQYDYEMFQIRLIKDNSESDNQSLNSNPISGKILQNSVLFSNVGEISEWIVPENTSILEIILSGSKGGDGGDLRGLPNNTYPEGLIRRYGGNGGEDGFVSFKLSVEGGEVLSYYIGNNGEKGADSFSNYNSGPGTTPDSGTSGENSLVYINDNLIIDLTGGAGGGAPTPYVDGGAGTNGKINPLSYSNYTSAGLFNITTEKIISLSSQKIIIRY